MQKDRTVYNCHTHTFTIDHVPNLFGRKLVPLAYQIVTMKLVKWYYLNLTDRSSKYRRWKQRWNKFKYFVVDVLKFTVIGYWVFSIIFFVLKWAFKIVSNFLAISNFFGPQSKAAYRRFVNLGRYASYSKQGQSKVFDLLEKTYDKNYF